MLTTFLIGTGSLFALLLLLGDVMALLWHLADRKAEGKPVSPLYIFRKHVLPGEDEE